VSNPTIDIPIYSRTPGEIDAILKMLLGNDSGPTALIEEDEEVTTPIVSSGPSGRGGDYQVEW